MPYTYQRPTAIKRPVRAVALPGGDTVHARALTLAELRRIDAAVAGEVPHLVAVRTVELIAARSLCGADGAPWFLDVTADDLVEVAELFTPEQLEAVCTAAVGKGKDAAGNG